MGGDERTAPLLLGPAGKKLNDFTHFATQMITRPEAVTKLAKVTHLIMFCKDKNKWKQKSDTSSLNVSFQPQRRCSFPLHTYRTFGEA